MSTGKVLLGVFAGLVAGGLLGVLLAPEKGSDTRKKISNKSKEYVDKLDEKLNEFIDNISEKFEKVKEEVSDFAQKAKTKSEEVKKGRQIFYELITFNVI